MQQIKHKETPPFVSFVIPTRNEEKMIGPCLGAIRGLNYDARLYDVIVVDNGSIDGTVEVARQSGTKIIETSNATISTLRNIGAREAKGGFLAFIDADCVLDKYWLGKALLHFADPVVACVGSYTTIPEGSSWVQRAWASQNKNNKFVEEVDWLPSRSILVEARAFEAVRGFNETLITCEDVDFCYRLKKSNYKIISDHGLKSVHLGEARTLSDFFRKERWRGRSNFRGIFSHGFYLEEIPSLLLPVFYLIAILAVPILYIYSFVRGAYVPVAVDFGCVITPALLLALRRTIRTREFGWLGHLIVLYLVSLLARATAMLPIEHGDGHRENC